MRLALISDIHGNAVALKAALEDLSRHPADKVVCLGDALQGGSQPAEVVDILKSLDCPVIMGNADSFLLTGASGENVAPGMLEVRDWTLAQLGSEGIEFIESFVPTLELELGGITMLCFHGSPNSFDDVLLPETPSAKVQRVFGESHANLMCGGHTHLQWTRGIGESVFFNPGSIGLPYSRHHTRETFWFYPIAEYAIVDGSHDQYTIEFCRVPFDVEELDRAAKASGRPGSEGEAARYRPPKLGA